MGVTQDLVGVAEASSGSSQALLKGLLSLGPARLLLQLGMLNNVGSMETAGNNNASPWGLVRGKVRKARPLRS